MTNHPYTWVQTASGEAFDLLAPSPEQVHPEDLAEHLSKIPRFAGATPNVVISVAQHSVLVAEALPVEARAYGLLHDGHEAYLGNDQGPKLNALTALAPITLAILTQLRLRAAAAIHMRFGLSWPPPVKIAAAVDRANARAVAAEKRAFMAPEPRPWAALPEPLSEIDEPWTWSEASERFYDMLLRYAPKWPV
ncbi:hypothetical protein [Microbaculum marinisediminis]|uniref:Phosphohydrolase n=1 Tax=Microbaculum marinisediminis TaxID=2931392 RepID=A0AAW5QUD0_9HYPH|nr:hypothetical protein [Microbaculum sp. A6E488]MCT8970557.1 hypothetical protein [Microbaculum sp. A6E488]